MTLRLKYFSFCFLHTSKATCFPFLPPSNFTVALEAVILLSYSMQYIVAMGSTVFRNVLLPAPFWGEIMNLASAVLLDVERVRVCENRQSSGSSLM